MPIEFSCTQCGKQLRTPDETAGRQAKCPQCGAIMQIPAYTSPPPQPQPPQFSPGEQPASPFGPAPQADAQQGWNPYASPNIGGESAQQRSTVAGEIVPTRVDLGRLFSDTWAIFKANMSICLLTGLTLCAIHLVFSFASNLLSTAMGGAANFAPGGAPQNVQLGSVIAAQLIIQLISWVLYTWLQMGTIRCFLRIARGQPATVGEIFSGGPYLWRGMLINLIFFVTGLVGAIAAFAVLAASGGNFAAFFGVIIVLIIVNAVIYLSISQSYALVVDRNMATVDSVKMSMTVMAGNKLTLFIMFLVVGILGAIFGIVTCLIGFIAVVPYIALIQAVFYLHATGQPSVVLGSRY